MYTLSQKNGHFYFYGNFGNSGPIFIVKFRMDLWRKVELKLPPTLKSVATLQNVSGHLHTFTFILVRTICFMLGSICFVSFYLFIYLFFSDTDLITRH